jgi:hypothetical protein
MSNGQGSAGNVIAALCSFFVPGLGQLIQGRLGAAIGWFVLACVLGAAFFVFTLGLLHGVGWFLVSVFSCINAALYRSPKTA